MFNDFTKFLTGLLIVRTFSHFNFYKNYDDFSYSFHPRVLKFGRYVAEMIMNVYTEPFFNNFDREKVLGKKH